MSSSKQNFNDETVIPHPYEEGKQITLGDLKELQGFLKMQLDFENTLQVQNVKFVAGIDIGHHKTDPERAKVVLVIFDFKTMKEVYRDSMEVKLTFPYIAGFLGFREVEHFMLLLNKVKSSFPSIYPDVILVDGNGILHYHQFGSACHLGVIAKIPTIGVAKTLYCTDGLKVENFKKVKKPKGSYVELKGDSGKIWGRALWNSHNASNCIFVSQGNYINLEEATKIVMQCSIHRIPEPIRQADLMSKVF